MFKTEAELQDEIRELTIKIDDAVQADDLERAHYLQQDLEETQDQLATLHAAEEEAFLAEEDLDDPNDDGQPTEYKEWQDYMGGDDWDHGQYDTGDEW